MATPYSTNTEVREQSPFKDDQLIENAYITQKIAEADDLINSVIGGTYILPLSENPNIVVNLSKEITTLILLREQDTNIEVQPGVKVEDAWKIAMETLKAIAARTIKLFSPTTNVELPLGASALPAGYPNLVSSSPDAPDNTSPKFTMNQVF